MKLFEMLFGTSELVLRLPNILSHLLYLVFTFKLFERYTPKYALLYFVLINSNPFLIDFFSLARGYGIAIGLMSAGLYYYCRYLETNKLPYQLASLFLLGFSCLANFALLTVFFIVIFLHNFFTFFINQKLLSLKNSWLANKFIIALIFFFAIILYQPIDKIITNNLLDFGGNDGFWEDTVRTLLYSYSYSAPYENALTFFLKGVIIFFSLLFIAKCIIYTARKKFTTMTSKLFLFFGLLLLLLIAGSTLQHWLLGTPFLIGRFAVFIYPIFITMSCFLLEDILTGFKKTGRIILFSVSSVFFFHTCYILNTSSYYEWKYDMNTKKMLQDLTHFQVEKDRPVSLDISWIFEPTINFYRQYQDIFWLNEVNRGTLNRDNDYCYLTYRDTNYVAHFNSRYTIINTYDNISLLATNKNTLPGINEIGREQINLQANNGKFICTDESLDNTILANKVVADTWETFLLIRFENDKCILRSHLYLFLSPDTTLGNKITTSGYIAGPEEIFILEKVDSNYIALKASNNKYVSLDVNSFSVFATSDTIGKLEKFKLFIQ